MKFIHIILDRVHYTLNLDDNYQPAYVMEACKKIPTSGIKMSIIVKMMPFLLLWSSVSRARF